MEMKIICGHAVGSFEEVSGQFVVIQEQLQKRPLKSGRLILSRGLADYQRGIHANEWFKPTIFII